jgi:hypothetical protein
MAGFHGRRLMVSNWWTRRAVTKRQWKIYGESSEMNSRRFFDELSPLQSLAIYRQWLGENRWRTTARREV